jgi:hypothetical protein
MALLTGKSACNMERIKVWNKEINRFTFTFFFNTFCEYEKKKTSWSESASELYRPRDRRLSAKRLPTFADRECHVVSVTSSYGHILGFLDRSRYFPIK